MKTIFQSLILLSLASFALPPAAMAQDPSDGGNGPATDDAVPLIEQEGASVGVEEAQPEPREIPAPAVSTPKQRNRTVDTEERNIRFNFSRADWKSVLDWFSQEAKLSLEYDQLPIGSFTYSDPVDSYSISQSLDIINLGLMKRGFALVRRGRSLQVIDLEVDNAEKLISEIAELVKPEELDSRGESDIVSCVFALRSMSPEAAKEELAQMVGPWGRVIVLTTARQVKVTETAAKLKAIRTVLESSSSAESNVVQMELEHRPADELLELARPLVGLEPGENVGDELRISVSVFGDVILATGDPAKVALLEAIIKMRDKPLPAMEGAGEAEVVLPVLRRHFVATADIATVFDILQTMLADIPDTRIGLDPNTKAVIAFARPKTQEMIEKTILEVDGQGKDFKVFNLRRLDPSQALLTINKFFGVTEEGGEGPIVDGDPVTGQLWVRGTTEEIAPVEKLLAELEGEDNLGGLGDKVRVLPYTGRAVQDALRQVQDLWQVTGRTNEIRTQTPSRSGGGAGSGLPERRIPREPDARNRPNTPKAPSTSEARRSTLTQYHLVAQRGGPVDADTDTSSSDKQPAPPAKKSDQLVQQDAAPSVTLGVGGSDIIVQFTPAGMIVASEDVEALNQFQALMDSVATPSSLQSDIPTIFWLKYCKADATAELISSVLGGSEGTLSSAVDSVTGGGLTGMLGLLGGGGGGGGGSSSSAKSILTATGSVMMVPEMRLNALIVQANPVDMQMIEMILEKVDRAESPENIETSPQPALIPVIYQDAEEVADVIKSVFAERIAGNNSGGAGGGRGGGGQQPSPQDFLRALQGGRGGGGRGAAPTSEPTKISIAVASTSNSLVVIASPQDFLEVKSLVEALDYPENEEIVGIQDIPGNINPEVIRLALESILGTEVKSTSAGSTTPSSSGATSTAGGSTQSAADIARRTEFFNRLRAGGAFGGAAGGRGGGAPGGTRGGPTGGGGPGFGRGGGGPGGGRGGR